MRPTSRTATSNHALDAAGGCDFEALATLSDPTRRALYEVVAELGRPVGRDEAASSLGIGRSLTAYHLDKLAELGLLEVTYARPEGRGGPGAGRPAKLYRRAAREFSLRTPPRDYRVLAELLARAADGAGDAARAAIDRAARDLGRELGAGVRRSRNGRRAMLEAALRSRGYEPVDAEAGTIRLRNCPFDSVAVRYPAIVCGLNLALIEGLLAGLQLDTMRAELSPQEGACCVAIHREIAGSRRT